MTGRSLGGPTRPGTTEWRVDTKFPGETGERVGALACPPGEPRGGAGHGPTEPRGRHGWEARCPASRAGTRADRWYAACFALPPARRRAPGCRRSVMRWWRAAGAAAVASAAA